MTSPERPSEIKREDAATGAEELEGAAGTLEREKDGIEGR